MRHSARLCFILQLTLQKTQLRLSSSRELISSSKTLRQLGEGEPAGREVAYRPLFLMAHYYETTRHMVARLGGDIA
jgi:hypothetical protein